MRILFILLSLSGLFLNLRSIAQAPDLIWANAIHTLGWIGSSVIISDQNGDVYVAGGFGGTVDFDPGPGTFVLQVDSAWGSNTGFVAKYDAAGAFLYVNTFKDVGINDLLIDAGNNLVLTALFVDTVDLDPGPLVSTFISPDGLEACVARFDAQGALLNAWAFGGSDSQSPEKLALDASGNIHVLGRFDNSIVLDPNGGTPMTSGPDAVFLGQYTAGGAYVNGFVLAAHAAHDLQIDANNTVLVSGDLLDPFDVDPGPGTTILSTVGGVDGWLARYDLDYQFVDAFSLDGGIDDVALDADNAVYIAGRLPDSMDVDLGAGVAMLYSEDDFDIYYVKYDEDLNFLHARAFEGTGTYTQWEMAIGYDDDMYLCGRFRDTVDFDPGGPAGTIISEGGYDSFFYGQSSGGLFEIAHSFGVNGPNVLSSMHATAAGEIFLSGDFNGTFDADMNSGTTEVSGAGNARLFFAKYMDPMATSVPVQTAVTSWIAIGGDDHLAIDLSAFTQAVNIAVHDLDGKLLTSLSVTDANVRVPLPVGGTRVVLVTIRSGQAAQSRRVAVH